MRKLTNLLTTLLLLLAANIQAQDSIYYYEQSFEELKQMYNGEVEANFERAVYLSEAPYWDYIYTYQQFQALINIEASSAYVLYAANNRADSMDFHAKVNSNGRFHIKDLYYTSEQKRELYTNVLKNWSIFKYITDTTAFFGNIHYPFTYSTDDPFGKEDWKNSQVINLISTETQSGNCYALTAFYKILADRMGAKATICSAPQHIYIQHKDEKGQPYNVELATAGHPSDGDLLTLTNSPAESIKSGIALRTYDDKELIGLCLVNLAKSYERKFKTKTDDFILKCADLALAYDSVNLNALLLKQEFYENKVVQFAKENNLNTLNAIKGNSAIAETFSKLEEQITYLYTLGYRPMPIEMQNIVLNGLQNQADYHLYMQDKNPSPFTSIKPLEKEDGELVSLSGGLFKEVHSQNDFERFGRFKFDTKKKTITSFLEEDYEQNLIDPVAFAYNFGARIYDSRVGRFLTIDPEFKRYPHSSPYVGLGNNPLYYVDPDGETLRVAGNEAAREQARAALQVLTNDKVIIQQDGLVVLQNGNQNPEKDLTEGTALLRLVSNHEKTATINIMNSGGNTSSKDGSTINFNPTLTEGGLNVEGSFERSPSIGLAHEFVHVLMKFTGRYTEDNHDTKFSDPDNNNQESQTIDYEEYNARVFENIIRAEQGEPARVLPERVETGGPPAIEGANGTLTPAKPVNVKKNPAYD